MRRWIKTIYAFFSIFSLIFVGGFFYTQPVQAQTPKPDFKVTQSSFNGLNLHVEYINATGVGYPRTRYEVGFQWYDTSGSALGTRHWLPVPEVERGGVAILDNKYRIDLTYRGRDGRNYNRTLAEFLYQRPDKAEELQVMVDDGNRVSETDESNNIARLRVPLPDLQITGAKFLAPNRLELSYRNANPSPIPVPFRIGFTWAEESGRVLNFTRFMNVLEPASGTTKTEILSRTEVSYINDQGREVGDRLDWYLEKRPVNATRLKITIDDAGTVREANEQNNLVSVRPDLPAPSLPDLTADLRIADFTMDPIAPRAGERVWFIVRVENVGNAATGKQTATGITVDLNNSGTNRKLIGQFTATDIAPGTSFTHRWTKENYYGWVAVEGTHTIEVCADRARVVQEKDETNNCAQRVVTVGKPVDEASKLPDLTITKEVLDGAALRYLSHNNGEGAAEPEVSFWYEWVDGQGRRIGKLYWINGGGMAGGSKREGNQLLDISTLEGEQGKIKLGELIYAPPAEAAHLKLTIDGPNAHKESNEQNNSVLLPVLRTDFTITDAEFRKDFPWFKYHNRGNLGHPEGKKVAFWFEWVDSRGARLGDLYWIDVDPPSILSARSASLARSTTFDSATTVFSAKGETKLTEFLNSAPSGATQLKITIDGPNVYAEFQEGNNVVLIDRAQVPALEVDFKKPDLAFSGVYIPSGRSWLAIEYKNLETTIGTPEFFWTVYWVDKTGQRLGTPYMGIGQALKPWGASGTSSDTNVPLGKWLAQPKPAGAARLEFVIDPDNKIAETNEANNRTTFEGWIPQDTTAQPDLTIVAPELRDDLLTFVYRNDGKSPANNVSIWFHFANSAGVQIGQLYWLDIESLPAYRGRQFTSKDVVVGSDTGPRPLTEVLSQGLAQATHFKVLVDGPQRIMESNELNNMALVEKPAPEVKTLPDLALTAGIRAGGVVKVTIVNGTASTINTPSLLFTWLDAKGIPLGTSPVSYWSGANIAPGKTGDFGFEYEKWREDGVIYFLKHPPSGAVALLATIDPENKLKESNEDNNSFQIGLTSIAELEYGKIEVSGGALNVEVRNSGTVDATATDIWMQWYGKGKWLSSGGVVDVPAVASGVTVELSVPLDRTFGADGRILVDIPPTAERLRLFLDGSRKVAELNENNNDKMLERSVFPSSAQSAVPELKLTLTAEVIKAKGAAAASPFATAGFVMALAALLSGAYMIHGHTGARSGPAGFFEVFPMLFTSPHNSYMFLRQCGIRECVGTHFNRHTALKRMTRTSLVVTLLTGFVKISMALALTAFTGPTELVSAAITEASPADAVRATMVAQNTGSAAAVGITLRLPCPAGTSWTSTRLNEKDDRRDVSKGLEVPDLAGGSAHRLVVVCKIDESAAKTLKFAGEAQIKSLGSSRFYSNSVEVAVIKPPEEKQPPAEKPDLTIEGVGFLPLVDIIEKDRAPFEAIFSGIVSNKGKKDSGVFRARVRVDHGSNGTWDAVSPKLVEVPSLAPGSEILVKLPLEWVAPIGTYTFEICVDPGRNLEESDEYNNCETDRFALKVGEEPYQEEEMIEE